MNKFKMKIVAAACFASLSIGVNTAFANEETENQKPLMAVQTSGKTASFEHFCKTPENQVEWAEMGVYFFDGAYLDDPDNAYPAMSHDRFLGLSEYQQNVFKEMGGVIYEEACGQYIANLQAEGYTQTPDGASFEDVIRQAQQDSDRAAALAMQSDASERVKLESIKNDGVTYNIQDVLGALNGKSDFGQLLNGPCSVASVKTFIDKYRGKIEPVNLDATTYLYLDESAGLAEHKCGALTMMLEEAGLLTLRGYSRLSPYSWYEPERTFVDGKTVDFKIDSRLRNLNPWRMAHIRDLKKAPESLIMPGQKSMVVNMGRRQDDLFLSRNRIQLEPEIKRMDLAAMLGVKFVGTPDLKVTQLIVDENLSAKQRKHSNEKMGGMATKISITTPDNTDHMLVSMLPDIVSTIPTQSLKKMGAKVSFIRQVAR